MAKGGETEMGRLTDDMTRLAGEIHAGHSDRERLVGDLKRGMHELRLDVAGMQAAFRTGRREMARRQGQTLRGFVANLESTVGSLRQAVATDLAGARQAWTGGTTAAGEPQRGGRTRGQRA